jgi:SAM-dependent methyltransferase
MSEGVSTERAAELNRSLWDSIRRQRDERLIPKQHDVAGDLLAGKSALYPEHRELVGDVRGKRLLDLGCGAGMELLEWARLGATVTGVDNSPRQIAAARRAAEQLGLECTLVVADLLRLPEELLRGEFDVVFSSWVTAWIGDLGVWFGSAARALKPGGVFVLTGGHPLSSYFGEVDHGEDYRKSYFEQGPFVFDDIEVNAEWNAAGDQRTAVEWRPMLGSIVTAVAQSGLRGTHLIEAGDANAKTGLPEGYPGRFTVRAFKER